MHEYLRDLQMISPVFLLLAGLLLGVFLQKIVIPRIQRASVKFKWEGYSIILESFSKVVAFWVILASILLTISYVEISKPVLVLIDRILRILFLISVITIFVKIAFGLIGLYTKKGKALASIFTNVTILIAFIVGILMILQTCEIPITPVLTALGVGGLAVALALQDTLSNIFAGLHIIASKGIRPGDFIKLDTGQEGYVIDVTWRNTIVRELSNNMVIIPNAKLASNIITNYYQPDKEMSLIVPVRVSYDSDLDRVEKITYEVGKEILQTITGGVTTYEPRVYYSTFGESGIEFRVILRIQEYSNQFLIKHEFIKKLFKRYKQEGIKIPFPVITVYTKNDFQQELELAKTLG